MEKLTPKALARQMRFVELESRMTRLEKQVSDLQNQVRFRQSSEKQRNMPELMPGEWSTRYD